MHSRLLLTLLPLASPLLAQSYTVSPLANTTTQGTASNPIPFQYAASRYQQIHGDLKGASKVIQGMSVRRGSGTQTNAVARTLDLTVTFANSDITKVSATFAANYVGTPTTVFPKASVNFPDWTVSAGSPEPWSIVVPFTTPFVYIGTNDLLWEWAVENNTGSTKSYAADVYSGITADMVSSTNVILGVSCKATGQTNPMSYGPRCYSSRALNSFYFKGTALYGAINQPSAILLGVTNPNLSPPGFCTNVYTDGLVVFPSVANATIGSFATPDLLIPYNPGFVGAKLYSQAVSADLGQPGFPVALSAGVENTLPALAAPGVVPIVRAFDLTSATIPVAGTVNFYAYGIIVRFTH